MRFIGAAVTLALAFYFGRLYERSTSVRKQTKQVVEQVKSMVRGVVR